MTGDTVADRHVHPATIPLRFLKEAPSTLLAMPAAFAFMSRPGIVAVLMFAIAIGGVALAFQWLAWSRFRYGIGEREVVIESGVFSRTRRSIPFDRIQDVDIERGPLARLFGLARLRIETGGSGGDEGVLDSVKLDEAERLRTALRTARHGARPQAEVAEQLPDDAQLLFAMTLPRLLAAGVLNFSMVWIAGIFAFLQTFGDWLPFDIYRRDLWENAGDGLRERFSLGALAAVALIALLLGIVTGIARTIGRDFGFHLTLESEGLRRQRGLFTRSDVLIPRARTQLAMIDTGPLRRLFGAYALTFQTLSGSSGRGESGPQSAAPLALRDEIDEILAALQGHCMADPASLEIVSSRRIIRRILVGILPLILVLVAGIFFTPALLVLPVLIAGLALAIFERRFHRFGTAQGLLFVQTGLWRQRQWVVPLAKIQSLKLSRGWLQRRLGLATLSVDTAGAPLLGGVHIEDIGEERARELVVELARAFST